MKILIQEAMPSPACTGMDGCGISRGLNMHTRGDGMTRYERDPAEGAARGPMTDATGGNPSRGARIGA